MLKKTIAQKLDAKEKQILKQFEQEAQNYTQLTEVNLDEQISKVYEVKVD